MIIKQLNKEQAIEFAKSEAWKELSMKDRAVFQLYQDKLCNYCSECGSPITWQLDTEDTE